MKTQWWLSSNPDLYPTPRDLDAQREAQEIAEWDGIPYNTELPEEPDPYTCPTCGAAYPQGNPQDHYCMGGA